MNKNKKVEPIEEGYYNVETLVKGCFIKRKEDAKKTYTLLGWCKYNRAYECQNFDDMNDCIYIKKGKKVFTGFTF